MATVCQNRKSGPFLLAADFYTVDQLLHFIQTHKFIYPVRVIIAGAEVYGSKIKFRSQNGNVAEAPERRLKAEAADMLLKLFIFAIVLIGFRQLNEK